MFISFFNSKEYLLFMIDALNLHVWALGQVSQSFQTCSLADILTIQLKYEDISAYKRRNSQTTSWFIIVVKLSEYLVWRFARHRYQPLEFVQATFNNYSLTQIIFNISVGIINWKIFCFFFLLLAFARDSTASSANVYIEYRGYQFSS